jgi:hypothetical protein
MTLPFRSSCASVVSNPSSQLGDENDSQLRINLITWCDQIAAARDGRYAGAHQIAL